MKNNATEMNSTTIKDRKPSTEKQLATDQLVDISSAEVSVPASSPPLATVEEIDDSPLATDDLNKTTLLCSNV